MPATDMNKTRVSIVKAHNYDLPEVRAAVEKSIDLLGGLAGIIPSGSKVFVKVNHLSPPSPAERGIVTHPVFVEAALDVLKGTGAEITVGDDIESGDGDGFLVSGIRQVCQRAGVRLINLREEGFVETECNGRFLDKVYSSKAVQEADLIVNLPKLKTHSLTVFTGGIKNMYGTIPIGLRRKFHGEYIRSQDFCQMLTDIFATVIPRLTIMDGIVAMEGEGPSGGKLRNLGLVLASRDAVALDAVASKIIGLNPQDIHTTRYAHERGLGRADLDNIEVVGETVESTAVADFRLPASASTAILGRVPRFLSRFILAQLAIKPKVVQQNCTGCAECEKTCPRGAITVSHDIAEINDSICIQCMCCHEVCRFDAIVPQQSALGRTVSSVTNIIRKLMSTA